MDAVFTILSVEKKPSGFGGFQWKLEIRIQDMIEDVELPPASTTGTYLTSVSGGDRDAMMEKVKELIVKDGPLYNAFVDQIDTGKPNPYTDLCTLDAGNDRYIEPPKQKASTAIQPRSSRIASNGVQAPPRPPVGSTTVKQVARAVTVKPEVVEESNEQFEDLEWLPEDEA